MRKYIEAIVVAVIGFVVACGFWKIIEMLGG